MVYNQLIIKKILRWLFLFPLAVAINIISVFCLNWIFLVINRSVFKDLYYSDDFRGHYIVGFLFIFLHHSISTGLSVYSGVYLAPNFKKTIFVFFLIIWGLITIGSNDLQIDAKFETLLRTLTEKIASFIGIVIAGVYIWSEQKQTKNNI
jgi:hypothetical protein